MTSDISIYIPPPLWRFDPIPGHGLPLRGFTVTHWTHHTR